MIRLKDLLTEQSWIEIASQVGEEAWGPTYDFDNFANQVARKKPSERAAETLQQVKKNIPDFGAFLKSKGFSTSNVQSTEADWETASSGIHQLKLGLGRTGIDLYKIIIQHPGELNQAGTFKIWCYHKNLKALSSKIRSYFNNNDFKVNSDGTCTFIIRHDDLAYIYKETKTKLAAVISLLQTTR